MPQREYIHAPDWIDVIGHMQYLREAYNADVAVDISVGTDGTEDALLCTTCIAWCRNTGHEPVLAVCEKSLSTESLRRLPQVVLDALFELHEEVDGGCVQCRATAGRG